MKSKYIRLTIIAVLIIGIGTSLYKLMADRKIPDYPEIAKSGVLRIVTNMDPVGYYPSSDTIAGYNHDILVAIEKYSNLKFEISLENSLDKCFEGLESGKYDLVARNIPINTNLRSQYKFTSTILYNKLVLIQRKAEYNDGMDPIKNHLDLANKTFHIPVNSPYKVRINNLAHEIGDSIFIAEDSLYEVNQLAMMVASKDIDYTVCDIKTAEKLASQIPEIDINTDIGFTHLEGWAVREQSSILLDSLNNWITRLKNSPEYLIIQKRYFP